MESLEQELMSMLRRLPTPVTITWRSGQYHWHCGQGSGSSSNLIVAIGDALAYLLNNTNADRVAIKSKELQ